MKAHINFIFIILFFIGCTHENQEKKPQIKSPKIVKIVNLKDINLHKSKKEYFAQLKPIKNEVLAFEVPGKIENFAFKVGEFVKKGDLIATLNSEIYKANYTSAQASFQKAKSDFKRASRLFKKSAISKTNYEQARQALDITKSNYFVAKKSLHNTQIVAHFDGIIADKFVQDFEVVVPKQPIATLLDKTSLKAEFDIPQTDIIRAKLALNIQDINQRYSFFVSVGEHSIKQYKATLTDISTNAQNITRTYKATVMIKAPQDTNILPGMTAKVIVKINNETKHKVFAPSIAIFSDYTKTAYIWVVNENKVHKREVQTGILRQNFIEVTRGLKGDESVVVSGINLLKEGEKITPYKKLSN